MVGDGPATAVKAATKEQHEDAVESSAATDVNFILAILWAGGALLDRSNTIEVVQR